MLPDFRDCCGKQNVLVHSAKSSTWDKHKYVKVIEGVYFYPNDYKGGRHIGDASRLVTGVAKAALRKRSVDKSKLTGNKKTVEKEKAGTSNEKDDKKKEKAKKRIEKLANDVISGKYGNGKERMDKLGKKYEKVQNRVNQILLGEAAAKRIYDKKQSSKKTTTKESSKATSKKKTVEKKKKRT